MQHSKNRFSVRIALTLFTFLIGSGCSVSPKQLEKTLDEHPEIIANLIEKHSDVIMGALEKASATAQQKAAEGEQEKEKQRMEAELKNPLQPKITGDRPTLGSGPITIVEYSDFQCPYCKRGYQTMKNLLQKHSTEVKLIFKHLPLEFHAMAMPAALRFEAIALQDGKKAYAFHDLVFEQQEKLEKGGEKFLDEMAKKAGADMNRLKKDIESDQVKGRIKEDMEEAASFGFNGTPAFIVAGVSVRGAYPIETFEEILKKKQAK